MRIKEQLLHAVAVEVGLPPPDRGRSRGHRSLSVSSVSIERGGETTQMPAQKSKESCHSKSNSAEDPLLYFACSAPKMQRDFRGQIRVGWSGKSWERQAK